MTRWGAMLLAAALVWPVAPSRAQAPAATAPWAEDAEARALFGAIRETLEAAAEARRAAAAGEGGGVMRRQLGLDSEARARKLLDSAFGLAAGAPVAKLHAEIHGRRDAIAALRDALARSREARLSAPDDAGIRGVIGLAEDRASIDADIKEAEGRIQEQETAIWAAKEKFRSAMKEAGASLTPEEADLLLESVAGEDLTRIAAAYQAARGVDAQLKALLDDSGEDLTRARRYYGMHAALIALLVEAQTGFLAKVDEGYLPKLDSIEKDLREARAESLRLSQARETTPDQAKALEANLESQKLALEAAAAYRTHLQGQRDDIKAARDKAAQELRVADNTLRTVDASFQLRRLMDSAQLSFEALKGMKSPGLERLFRNERLRREFEGLTRKLAPQS